MGGGSQSKLGVKLKSVKTKVDRTFATRTYADGVLKLAEQALEHRPLGMAPPEFAEDFVARVRAAGVAETWLRAIFVGGAAIESAAEIDELVGILYDTWAKRTPELFAQLFLWDLRNVLATCTLRDNYDAALTLDGARAIVVKAADGALEEKLAESGRDGTLAAGVGKAALFLAFKKVDVELKDAAETIAADFRKLYAALSPAIKAKWANLLDPSGSGRLEASTLAQTLLYDGAQRFAADTSDLGSVAEIVGAKLAPLRAKMAALPEGLRDAALAALATAEAGLGQLAAASAAARSALLNDFIFPLAMASPLLPPQPRVPPRPPVPDDPRAQFAAVQAELKAQAEAARAELERARARVAELEAEVARLKEGK